MTGMLTGVLLIARVVQRRRAENARLAARTSANFHAESSANHTT